MEMNKKIIACLLLLICILTAACGQGKEDGKKAPIEDGVYTVDVDTDSSMFHINDALDGKCTLTVKDGKMTVHMILASKKITKLYYGLSKDAKKEGVVLIEPVTDTVTFSDGLKEEAYGFDVPVPALGEEFDLALLGKKGTWYDHKVMVANPTPLEAGE